MLPFEILLLSVLTVGSVTQALPAAPEKNLSIKPLNLLDWSQVSLSDNRKLKPVSSKKHEYECFGGDLSSYPDHEEGWRSWVDLWNINREQILSSNGGDTYIQHYIEEAILQVAKESHVDARFILAVVMQESKGNADILCAESNSRCGIMHARKGSKFDAEKPRESVLQMIRDGVDGRLRSGPGLAILLSGKPRIANVPFANPYAVARMYNSGSVGEDLDDVAGRSGEAGYVNDIANRLVGWDGHGKGFKTCQ